MRTSIACTALILGFGFIACTPRNNSAEQTQTADSTVTQTTGDIKNLVSIVEIPVTDFSRAVKFYEAILNLSIEETDMAGTQMGILPGDSNSVNVVLIKGIDYKPSKDGTLVYLNAGDDLQRTLDKIKPNGGKILVPKTEISPEMGFFALFADIEGNKIGLHSKK